MKERSLFAAAFAMLAGAAHAETSKAGIEAQIAKLPFVRAEAYALAVDNWCFLEEPLNNSKLWTAAQMQVSSSSVEDQREKAWAHVSRDQAVCEPAAAFIERTMDNFDTLKAELDRLTAEREAIIAKEQEAARKEEAARNEAGRKAREEAKERARKYDGEKCRQAADPRAELVGDDYPWEQESQLGAKVRFLKSYCGEYLTADQIAAANAAIAAEMENVKKRKGN